MGKRNEINCSYHAALTEEIMGYFWIGLEVFSACLSCCLCSLPSEVECC